MVEHFASKKKKLGQYYASLQEWNKLLQLNCD